MNFSKPTSKTGDIGHFNLLDSFLTNFENQLQCTAEFVLNALKQLFFVLIVFTTVESMSCIHIKQ